MRTMTLALVLCCTALSAQVCGDCTGDGQVDILDALDAALVAIGEAPIDAATFGFESCDVTADGRVDVIDALRIAQFTIDRTLVLACI